MSKVVTVILNTGEKFKNVVIDREYVNETTDEKTIVIVTAFGREIHISQNDITEVNDAV